jgi:non-ribosomal peptide synthetase component E (peptide arylation enzyme)
MEMTSTVAEVIRRSARRWPTRIALHFGERRWSYEELLKRELRERFGGGDGSAVGR